MTRVTEQTPNAFLSEAPAHARPVSIVGDDSRDGVRLDLHEMRHAVEVVTRAVDRDSWRAIHEAALGVPAMLRAALVTERSRQEAIRVARVVRQLHEEAVEALGDREADDVVGATLRHVRGRVVDIFGPAAWDESAPR